ncbi:GNAT family N-acetyltransferase [Myroides sp. mNGS23_01]|nr:GNAT family N-acetyltransferase [Myroides sp. mNGS23_01]WHT38365.1 GNAT family N-acetyltransferase [Myroides sp. mNGS23_01]
MIRLEHETIYLRALEPEDLEFIYQIENDLSLWEVSNTQTPYSRFLIHQYLENAHLDIYEAKQLRLVICSKATTETLGLIDLFDFDPKNGRAGVGIVIQKETNRAQGVGSQALELVLNYSREYLYLNQLYANIASDNQASIQLFTKFDFREIGIKKAWTRVGQTYKDEIMYQLIF